MKKQILTAIFVSFLVGFTVQMATVFIYMQQLPARGTHKSDFAGLLLGIPFLLNIFLIFFSLSALFLGFEKINRNPILTFLFWFLPRTLFIFFFIGAMGDWDFQNIFSKENLLIIPFANSVAWWICYFKVKRKYGSRF